MSVNFPYSRINPQVKNPAGLVQRNLEYLAEQIGDLGQSSAFVNVKDAQFGAKGDGTTNDTAAIASAIASLPATGGTVIFPPGEYLATITITENKRIHLLGYGATIKIPASGTGVSIQAVNGSNAVGQSIDGLMFDGSAGGTTGIRITNTDWVSIQNFRIWNCTTGIELLADNAGWVEGTYIANGVMLNGTIGLYFNATVDSGNSVGENVVNSVGINNYTTGIETTQYTYLYRCAFTGVTIWINNNQTGFRIRGNPKGTFLMGGIETLDTGTGTIGVDVTSTAVDPYPMTAHLVFDGPIAQKVAVASGKIFRWNEGGANEFHQRGGGDLLRLWKYGDTWMRVAIDSETGGIAFGGGAGAPDVAFWRNAANVLAFASGDALWLGTTPDGGGSYLQLWEQTSDPATGPGNSLRLFAKDDGMGKTQIAVRWPGGNVQVLATEP